MYNKAMKKIQARYEHELLEKVKNFVIDSNNKVGRGSSNNHLIRTVYWIKNFKPNADLALLTAGYAHDIERTFRKKK